MKMQRRRSGALLLVALSAACLQDAPSAPAAGVASLAMQARVVRAASSVSTGLDVLVRYERGQGGPATLLQQQIAFSGGTAAGASGDQVQPITLDLSRCLADPQHLPGAGKCSLSVRVTLVGGASVLDEVTLPAFSLSPGRTVTAPPVTLYEVATLAITPPRDPTLFPGETAAFTAQLLAADGTLVGGREVTWTSSAATVAAVAGGNVTAAGLGSATITATAGGRSATRAVKVIPRPQLQLSDTLANLVATLNSELGYTQLPAPAVVTISNATATPATGLAVGTIYYQGGQTGWLAATLGGTTAPTKLTLAIVSTGLPPGTYTATVPIQASAATNSPQSVTVHYVVQDDGGSWSPGYSLFFTLDSLHAGQLPLGAVAGTPGLVATVQYGPGITGWLQTTVTNSSPPSVTVQPLPNAPPGNHQAIVSVSSPTTPTVVIGTVQYVVDYSAFTLRLNALLHGMTAQFVERGDTLVLLPVLSSGQTAIPGVPVTISVLDPGLTLLATGAVTGKPVLAVPVDGYRGVVRIALRLTLDSGAHADTVAVFVDNGPMSGVQAPGGAGRRAAPLPLRPSSPPPARPEPR